MKSLKINNEMMTESVNDEYFPKISISTNAIPELEDMKDGDTCMLCIKVKKTGSNSTNNDTRVHLDVVAGEYMDKESKDEEDSYNEEED